jgi:integrase
MVTKTEATSQAYHVRAEALWVRASRETNSHQEFLSPLLFIEWLKKLLVTLRPSSKRQYIAACREYLHSMTIDNEQNTELESAIKIIMSIQGKDFNNPDISKIPPPKTSSHKAKHFNLEKFISNCNKDLQDGKSQWTLPALIWITANVLVGLRPCEWRHAKLIIVDSKPILKVKNAKSTNGRAHGEFRHIDISSFSKKHLNLIKTQLRFIRDLDQSQDAWDSYYNSVRRRIFSLVRKVDKFQKRYPSLYSTRHQYAADAKSAGLDLASIAALMGHATDETVRETYGRKKDGSGHFSAQPDSDEVARVKSGKTRKIERKILPF